MKNKKSKILILIVLTAVLALTAVFALSACNKNKDGKYYRNQTFYIANETSVMDINPGAFGILDEQKSVIKLSEDGTFRLSIILNNESINSIMGIVAPMLKDLPEGEQLKATLDGFKNSYLNELFPGFSFDDIAGSFDLLKKAMGVYFTGIDLHNEDDPLVKALNKLVTTGDKSGLISTDEEGNVSLAVSIPDGFGIEFVGKYYMKDLKSNVTGKTYKGVFVGYHEIQEDPFLLLNIEDKEGESTIDCRVRFIKLQLKGSTIAPTIKV